MQLPRLDQEIKQNILELDLLDRLLERLVVQNDFVRVPVNEQDRIVLNFSVPAFDLVATHSATPDEKEEKG